jgi:hypothetical protein
MEKRKSINEQLEMIEKHLANAEEYVALGLNVEGSPFLHLDDWRGRSGHPLWMKYVMIPMTVKQRAHEERALEKIEKKHNDQSLSMRKRKRKF